MDNYEGAFERGEPQPAEDSLTKSIEQYTASIPISWRCRRRHGFVVRVPARRARQMGQLHCPVGTDLADHRRLQQIGQTRRSRSDRSCSPSRLHQLRAISSSLMNFPQQAAGYRQTLIIFLKVVAPEWFYRGPSQSSPGFPPKDGSVQSFVATR
jgi:hypothetical protein